MNSSYPPFSVLMSVYAKDRPAWIAQALLSVLENTVPPAEVIVAVDGPVSEEIRNVLTEYAKKYPSVKVYPFEKNEGLGVALQKGILLCSHEFVARMDSDDISLPDRFEKQLTRFKQEPDLAVLGGAIEEVDAETLQGLFFRRVPLQQDEILNRLKTRSPFNHVTVMLRKTAVLAAGNYRSFPLLEDYDLWVRCAAAGLQMANLPDMLVRVRVGQNMFARRGGLKYFKNNRRLYRQMRGAGLLSVTQYWYILCVRFCVQVVMPSRLRRLFYQKALR